MKSSTSRSNLILLGPNAVYSLLPSTLISQVEALLSAHRIEDAVDMADQQRRRVEARMTVDEGEVRRTTYGAIPQLQLVYCQGLSYRRKNFDMSINALDFNASQRPYLTTQGNTYFMANWTLVHYLVITRNSLVRYSKRTSLLTSFLALRSECHRKHLLTI